MGHVNNAAYVDYLEEALDTAGRAGRRLVTAVPRRVRLEYVAAAAPGARLLGAAWPKGAGVDDGWAWRQADDDGNELARGEVTGDGREAT